jgi:ABC-type Fe3+-hydroxamate transport system substrate-binding protein
MSSTRPRRTVLAWSAAAVGTLLTGGCGGHDTAESGRKAGPKEPKDGREVTDALGRTVSVPGTPKRVVTLGASVLDLALAFGAEPVGVAAGGGTATGTDGRGLPAYLADLVIPARTVGTTTAVDLDRLTAAKPDLILVEGTAGRTPEWPKQLDALISVAPTVVTAGPDEDWRAAVFAFGDMVDKGDKAVKLLQTFDDAMAAGQLELADEAGAPVAVLRWENGKPTDLTPVPTHVTSTLSGLGLTQPEPRGLQGVVPREEARWLFLCVPGNEGRRGKACAEAGKDPAFARLPAVRGGRVTVVDESAWTAGGGPLAARAVLEDVTGALTR